ncbi:MAG: hypothetical protein WC683_01320 [bacterium]
MNRSQLLQRLQSLAAHSGTPEHERASALARIREIEAVAREEAAAARKSSFVAIPKKAGRARLGKMRVHAKRPLPEQWPFGWTGTRGPVEYEAEVQRDGSIVVGWKCPGCGAQVERRLSGSTCAYLRRTAPPDILEARVRAWASGATNLLCLACWQRWDAA